MMWLFILRWRYTGATTVPVEDVLFQCYTVALTSLCGSALMYRAGVLDGADLVLRDAPSIASRESVVIDAHDVTTVSS